MAEYLNPFHAPSWNQQDVDNLKAFLRSQTGKRLVFRLRFDRPGLPSGDLRHNIDATALAAQHAFGYDQAVANLFDYLVTPVASDATGTNYPSLDDEILWPEIPVPQVKPPLVSLDVPNEAEPPK